MKNKSKKKFALDKKVVAKLTDRDSAKVKGGNDMLEKKRAISPLCMTYDVCTEA